MTIIAKSIEQDVQNETTRIWFDVDGEMYAIADNNGSIALLDNEGFPFQDGEIEQKLTPQYKKIAKEFCGEDCILDIAV